MYLYVHLMSGNMGRTVDRRSVERKASIISMLVGGLHPPHSLALRLRFSTGGEQFYTDALFVLSIQVFAPQHGELEMTHVSEHSTTFNPETLHILGSALESLIESFMERLSQVFMRRVLFDRTNYLWRFQRPGWIWPWGLLDWLQRAR